MDKFDYTTIDLKKKAGNKYAAVIIIANRAKQLRENPADTDEENRRLKPTYVALKEFMEDKLKYPEFDIKKINDDD
ncbi:MAG: DNA-directed RNA polymerase subunit omega [Candidatus Goldbacteria bacterium]|nr:DNA-directed RNA polymerase subunit omega [Candidatus Goldiibacteriota bacterium]